jgi:hypothetical protein
LIESPQREIKIDVWFFIDGRLKICKRNFFFGEDVGWNFGVIFLSSKVFEKIQFSLGKISKN